MNSAQVLAISPDANEAIQLRRGVAADAQICGQIVYDAFRTISEKHNFPPDFPNPEVAIGMITGLLAHPRFYSVIAERGDSIVGSNFMDERNPIAGIGPITVNPACQDSRVGRLLMNDVMARAENQNFAGVRLVQAAYHSRSLSLYTKLGFDIREPLAVLQGPALMQYIPGYTVRPALLSDLDACNRLCRQVHGHDRAGELTDATNRGTARVVEQNGQITGYTTAVAFFGHTVGEGRQDVQALIADATGFGGPGFLLPIRDSELFRWCLNHGLRVVMTMTLMSKGLYNEPRGTFLPSVFY